MQTNTTKTITATEKTEAIRQALMQARNALMRANELYVEACPKMSDEFLSIYPVELSYSVDKLMQEIPVLKSDLYKFMEKKGII